MLVYEFSDAPTPNFTDFTQFHRFPPNFTDFSPISAISLRFPLNFTDFPPISTNFTDLPNFTTHQFHRPPPNFRDPPPISPISPQFSRKLCFFEFSETPHPIFGKYILSQILHHLKRICKNIYYSVNYEEINLRVRDTVM